MLYDLAILDDHRTKLESQLAESKEVQRDLKLRLDRHHRDETEYAGRLKYGPGMADTENEMLNTRFEAAKKGTLDLSKQLKTSENAAAGIEWGLNEIGAEIDLIFLDFKKRFGHLVGKTYDGPEAAAKLTPNTAEPLESEFDKADADDVEVKQEDAKVRKLSESKKLGSLREGILRLVEHFSDLANLKLFVQDPLADDVPHFTAWEQRTQTTIFTAKEKIERTQRYCGNVLNAVSTTFPALAQDATHWSLFVSLVDDALRRLTLRNVQNALYNYSRCLQGVCSRELFAINLKLGANCRVSFVPMATEIANLVNGIVTKVLGVGSERYIGDTISVAAAAPTTPPGASKGTPFIKAHGEFVTVDLEVSRYVNAIRTSTGMFNEDIVGFVVDVENRFEHMWGPEMTALSETQLVDSISKIQVWNPERSLKGAVLINAFPLQDSVISMCQAQLQRVRKQDEEKAISPAVIEGRLRPSTLSLCTNAPWTTVKTKSARQPVRAHDKDDVPSSVPPLKKKKTVSTNSAIDQENNLEMQASSAQRTTPRLGTTPRQLAPLHPVQENGREGSNSSMNSAMNSGRLSKGSSPPMPSNPVAYSNTTPQESPRPSTTPVGTRTRGGSTPLGSQQSSTPQKYQGPSTLRNEGSVYARALGVANNNTPTTHSPTAPLPPATKSVEVKKPAGGRNLESSSPAHAGTVPEVQALSSSKKSAWGTPSKNQGSPDLQGPARGGSTGGTPTVRSSTGGYTPVGAAPPEQYPPLRPSPRQSGSGGNSPVQGGASGNSPVDDGEEIQRMLQKEQDTLRRIRELKEREEERRIAREASPPKQSAKDMYLAEKEKRDREERAKASKEAQQKQNREESIRIAEQAEIIRRRREAEVTEQKEVAAKREADNRRKQREMEERLEVEMRRREDVQKKVLEDRRKEDERARVQKEEQRLARERVELQRLEKQCEDEEKRQADAMADYQRKMSRINEETSALRKKLQLPPVQPPNQRVPAEPTSPPPVRSGSTPSNSRPLPSTTPSNTNTPMGQPGGGSYTLPNRPSSSSSQPLLMTPLPFEDDGVVRSLLDDYRRCCSAAGIKPNSGLLKKLPKEVGEHIIDINLDLNYIGIKGAQPLIHILKKNRGLRLLNLKDNNLENNEVRQLVSVLMTESGDCLEVIDLSNNPISLAGGSALLDLVTAKRTLQTVHLKGTLIQPRVVERIVEAATENGKALQREDCHQANKVRY